MEYTELKMSAATTFSIEAMRDSIKAMEWLEYEVAPEWRRFCSFGPEDIGGVWEKIGAIRKRPHYSLAVISQQMAARINKHFETELLSGNGSNYGSAKHDAAMFGIRMQVSPVLSGMTGFLLKDT